jgi:hypothetical protein
MTMNSSKRNRQPTMTKNDATDAARTGRWLRVLLLLPLLPLGCGGSVQSPVSAGTEDGAVEEITPDAAVSPVVDASFEAGSAPDATNSETGPATPDATSDTGNAGDALADSGAADGSDDVTDSGDAETADASLPCPETTACATAVDLGTIWSGVMGGTNEGVALQGHHSEWYKVKIIPYPLTPIMTDAWAVHVYFGATPGVDYDVDVYSSATSEAAACSQLIGTAPFSGDAAAAQELRFSYPYGAGTWVVVHVVAKTGSQCSTGDHFYLSVSDDGS